MRGLSGLPREFPVQSPNRDLAVRGKPAVSGGVLVDLLFDPMPRLTQPSSSGVSGDRPPNPSKFYLDRLRQHDRHLSVILHSIVLSGFLATCRAPRWTPIARKGASRRPYPRPDPGLHERPGRRRRRDRGRGIDKARRTIQRRSLLSSRRVLSLRPSPSGRG